MTAVGYTYTKRTQLITLAFWVVEVNDGNWKAAALSSCSRWIGDCLFHVALNFAFGCLELSVN